MFDNYSFGNSFYESKCESTSGFTSFNQLMQNLKQMCEQPPSMVSTMSLRQNPYFFALQDLLIERKKEIGSPTLYDTSYELTAKNAELDSNLNEYFEGEEDSNDESSEDVEEIREDYEKSAEEIDGGINQASMHLQEVLKKQQDFRPITHQDVQTSMEALKQRQFYWETELKAMTCNRLILLRTKRKRKNFSKAATQILNEYFDSHMDQPYPDDDTKAELAKKCGITPVQVSNWFGNKRIRFRKALLKREATERINHPKEPKYPRLKRLSSSFEINSPQPYNHNPLNFPFLDETNINHTFPRYVYS